MIDPPERRRPKGRFVGDFGNFDHDRANLRPSRPRQLTSLTKLLWLFLSFVLTPFLWLFLSFVLHRFCGCFCPFVSPTTGNLVQI